MCLTQYVVNRFRGNGLTSISFDVRRHQHASAGFEMADDMHDFGTTVEPPVS